MAAQFERSGAHLVGQVRLLDVALVLGHRGGAVSGLGWGMWGWVFACSRCAALKKWSTAS